VVSAERLTERLAAGVLVADGAMGTVLHAAGYPLDRALPELNLSDPALVRRIHDSYLAAGVGLLQTNTFGAGPLRLEPHGLADRAERVNAAGVRVAREAASAAGGAVLVAGSVGPAVTVQQRRRVSAADREAALRDQVRALVEAGVDLLVLETFGYLDELVEAAGVALDVAGPEVAVLAQATFAADGHTLGGDGPREVCAALHDLPVAALGTNCTLGPQGMLAVLQQLREHTSLPLSALPNAGLPRRRSGNRAAVFSYGVDEQYFARYAQRLVAAGAALVGGCCGTTPAHLDAMVRAVAPGAADPDPSPERPPAAAPQPVRRRAGFRVLAEIEPPQAGHVEAALSHARAVRDRGVRSLLISAGGGPRAQLNPVNLAVHLQLQLGVRALASVTTWDRTIMALQADLLGAHALGVRRIVCETGSPPLLGDYPNVDGVWDVDSVGLVELLAGLNDGRDCNGLRLAEKTAFEIGARVSAGTREPAAEAAQALRKVAAGAEFLITRPVYDLDSVRRLREALGEPVPLLAAVRPLTDYAEADFLAHEVPDTEVPGVVLDVLARAGGAATEAGVDLAVELLRGLRSLVDGVVLALPTDPSAADRLLAAARGE
jgi:methionine synthase I (cobalamin-dependent)/5,10-methylenetetrahydrofolate reductase